MRTRGPGSESSLTLSDRPISECLAHQSEAPAGWQRRRDVPLQCSPRKWRAAWAEVGFTLEEQSSGERSSRTVESTSTRRKSSLFAEGWRKQVSAGSCAMNGVSSPFVSPSPVTRVLGSNDEEGSSHSCEPFTHELSTRAPRLRSRRCGSSRRSFVGSASGMRPRSLSRTRIERSPQCARVS